MTSFPKIKICGMDNVTYPMDKRIARGLREGEQREPSPAEMTTNTEHSTLGASKSDMKRKENVGFTSSNRPIHTQFNAKSKDTRVSGGPDQGTTSNLGGKPNIGVGAKNPPKCRKRI